MTPIQLKKQREDQVYPGANYIAIGVAGSPASEPYVVVASIILSFVFLAYMNRRRGRKLELGNIIQLSFLSGIAGAALGEIIKWLFISTNQLALLDAIVTISSALIICCLIVYYVVIKGKSLQ